MDIAAYEAKISELTSKLDESEKAHKRTLLSYEVLKEHEVNLIKDYENKNDDKIQRLLQELLE